MFTQSILDAFEQRLSGAIQDDPENGVFRCRRDIFTDEEMFEPEMKHIFEGNWIYLAHESQIPNKNDYYTTHMGRQPIFIARNKDGSYHLRLELRVDITNLFNHTNWGAPVTGFTDPRFLTFIPSAAHQTGTYNGTGTTERTIQIGLRLEF